MDALILLALVGVTFYVDAHYGSVGEWFLHKNIMHRPFFGFRYAYEAHARTHHRLFGHDESYHLGGRGEEVKDKIAMAWWNSFVIIGIGGIPLWLAALAAGYFWWPAAGWAICITSLVTFFGYYGVYEWSHWRMHLPKNRWTESLDVFLNLNRRHRLHHKQMGRNFNVVFPFADRLFGTYLV